LGDRQLSSRMRHHMPCGCAMVRALELSVWIWL